MNPGAINGCPTGEHLIESKREFPATLRLLKRTEEFPNDGLYGPVTGFNYSTAELAELLPEISKHTAVGVHAIEHSPDGDMTSLRITVYVSFARSEYGS